MGLETSSQLHVAPEDASPAQLPYLSSGIFTGLLDTLKHTQTYLYIYGWRERLRERERHSERERERGREVLVDKKQLEYLNMLLIHGQVKLNNSKF